MNRWIVAALLGVVVTLIHSWILSSDWGERLEPAAADLWFNIRGELEPPEDFILIAMDEDSYQELDISMDQVWPRAVHAKLLQRLAKAGVKRVIFDVLFYAESSDKKVDKELADAMGLLPTVVGAETGTNVRTKVEQVLEPADIFLEKVEQVALVGVPEIAGMVRTFKTTRTGRTEKYLTLSEAGAGIDRDKDPLPGPRDLIWYYGPAGTINTYSYFEVLDEKIVPSEDLEGKVAYVGLMLRTDLGPAQKDSYLTPFWQGGRMFGVEIHVTAAANLKHGIWVKRLSSWTEILGLGICAFLMTIVLFTLRPGWAGLSLIAFVLTWAAVSFSAFTAGTFIPGVVLCMIVLPIMYLGSTLYFYFVSHQAQKQTQRAFELYLSPAMAREAGKDPQSLELGGENLYATAMFTDIAGFTQITESMLAEKVAQMLNAYFTEVMDVIFEKEGTLIKFIGDAVFALWGAPVKIPDHAEKTVQTALAIQKEVNIFNNSNRFPPLKTRIGIHTGPMVVGNLGSERRFDYTGIGDTVNLAARVEGLNKYFGTDTLITEATKKELSGQYNLLSMGQVNVVGKSDTVGVFTIFEEPVLDKTRELWLGALAEFRAKSWDESKKMFEEAHKRDERLVKAAQLYFEQIERARNTKLEVDWAGQVVFEGK